MRLGVAVLSLLLVARPVAAWDGSQRLEPGLTGADLLLFEDFKASDFGDTWPTHWGDPPGPATVSSPAQYVFDGARSLHLSWRLERGAARPTLMPSRRNVRADQVHVHVHVHVTVYVTGHV